MAIGILRYTSVNYSDTTSPNANEPTSPVTVILIPTDYNTYDSSSVQFPDAADEFSEAEIPKIEEIEPLEQAEYPAYLEPTHATSDPPEIIPRARSPPGGRRRGGSTFMPAIRRDG